MGPVLANLFMGHFEGKWIEGYQLSKPSFYKRFMDDIFCLFENEKQAKDFLDYLNLQHPNIKFTDEKEKHGKLAFLDVQIEKSSIGWFHTSVYRKSTFTGLLTNFKSFVPFSYKLALVKTLIHRIFQICNTWTNFHKDVGDLEKILGKNCFPPKVIAKQIRNYLNDKLSPEKKDKSSDDITPNYYKLPYIGNFSKTTKNKISEICKKYCKTLSVRLCFSLFKTGSLFSVKDVTPPEHKPSVVYLFSCTGCETSYVGETAKRYCDRVQEHLFTDKGSKVFQHLKSNVNCKNLCDTSSFKILDSARTDFQRKLKEAIHIEWRKPSLNKQVKHVILSITV